jgi:uncharacterized RDD family membrane protein YckC
MLEAEIMDQPREPYDLNSPPSDPTGSPPAPDPLPGTVAIPGTEASLGERIGAYLIDLVLAIAVAAVLGRISGVLFNIVLLGYMLTRDSLPFLDGQSIGKKVLKIRAVTETGASLSENWGPGLLRNVVLLIPLFPLVELIVLIAAQGKPGGLRRLGDQWAKTKVVTARS